MGRSAYLCHNAKCLQRVRKKNRLRHALRATVPPQLYDDLAVAIASAFPTPEPLKTATDAIEA